MNTYKRLVKYCTLTKCKAYYPQFLQQVAVVRARLFEQAVAAIEAARFAMQKANCLNRSTSSVIASW